MKKKEALQDPEFRSCYGIVLDGELYKSLPQGKVRHLTNFMNGILVPNIDEELTVQYFNTNAEKVPAKNFEFLVELMADALRDTAELMAADMSAEAIKLKRQYDKAKAELSTVKTSLTKDKENRKQLEVQ